MMNVYRLYPKTILHKQHPIIQFLPFSSSTTTTTTTATTTTSNRSHGKARTRRPKKASWFQETSPQIPSLKDFIHRQTVIRQYRSFLKAIQKFPDQQDVADAKREVQSVFRLHQFERNALTVKMAVTDGQRRLAQVQSLVGYQPTAALASPSPEQDDEDSWLNIKDDLDKRGRVGEEWPWERKDDDEESKKD